MGRKYQGRKESDYVDGREGRSEMYLETGAPQGSPVWPVLVVLYLSGLFSKVEENEEGWGIERVSFVDEMPLVVEGEDVGECKQRLERCAAETRMRAKQYTCQFDIEKTEAIFFTQREKNNELKMTIRIRVGDHKVQYHKKATRWLEVWLDDLLTLNDHTKKTFAKTKKAQNRVISLMTKNGLNSARCERIQVMAVQAAQLYGSELWW